MPKPLKLSLDAQLCFALYAATNAVTRSYRPRLDALGLTYPQYLVMLVLWQDGTHPIGHIARRLKLPPNAVTPLLDRLQDAGFVRREADKTDRRVTRIALTVEGAALEHAAALEQRDVACETGLEPKALDKLRDELHAMTEHMEGEMATQSQESREDNSA